MNRHFYPVLNLFRKWHNHPCNKLGPCGSTLRENKSLLRAYLPHDVVELNLQVKTTQGMHQIRRDAWGGHSHSFKKWGSQIQPTPPSRNKITKFKEQWKIYQGELARRANAESIPKNQGLSPLPPEEEDQGSSG